MATVFKNKQRNAGLNILGELFYSTPQVVWNITQPIPRLYFDKLSGARSGVEICAGEFHIWKNGKVAFYEAVVKVQKSSGNKLSLQIEANGKKLLNPNFEATISELVTINDANDWISVYRLYQGNQLIGTLKEGWLNLCFIFNEMEVFFLGKIGN